MPFGSNDKSKSLSVDIVRLLSDIEKLTKRIKYLESLHKCTCSTSEEQSKMISGAWNCSLHGEIKIIFQSRMFKMIDKNGGHIAR